MGSFHAIKAPTTTVSTSIAHPSVVRGASTAAARTSAKVSPTAEDAELTTQRTLPSKGASGDDVVGESSSEAACLTAGTAGAASSPSGALGRRLAIPCLPTSTGLLDAWLLPIVVVVAFASGVAADTPPPIARGSESLWPAKIRLGLAPIWSLF